MNSVPCKVRHSEGDLVYAVPRKVGDGSHATRRNEAAKSSAGWRGSPPN